MYRHTSTPFSCTILRNRIELIVFSRLALNLSFMTSSKMLLPSSTSLSSSVLSSHELLMIQISRLMQLPVLLTPFSSSPSMPCLLSMFLAAKSSAFVWKNFSLLRVPDDLYPSSTINLRGVGVRKVIYY